MKKFTQQQIEKLYGFLDWYNFIDSGEIIMAIEEFDRENVENNQLFCASYWELAYYWKLCDNYIRHRWIIFE